MRNVGFNSTVPEITRVSFRKKGAITLYLEDGRTLSAPLTRFPGIEKLTSAERQRYHIADGSIVMFPNDDDVYHIQDFLGTYETNSYNSQNHINSSSTFYQIVVSLGPPENFPVDENLFVRLTNYWQKEQVIHSDLLVQQGLAEAVVFRLQKTDDRLYFPDTLIAGEVRGEPNLSGFSGKFQEQGWVIIPAELSSIYKNLFLNILIASLGLEYLYSSQLELLTEAEKVTLAAMLPEAEVRKFFGLRLSRFPDNFRDEVSSYFNLPFQYILKRAYHLGLLTNFPADYSLTQLMNPLTVTTV